VTLVQIDERAEIVKPRAFADFLRVEESYDSDSSQCLELADKQCAVAFIAIKVWAFPPPAYAAIGDIIKVNREGQFPAAK